MAECGAWHGLSVKKPASASRGRSGSPVALAHPDDLDDEATDQTAEESHFPGPSRTRNIPDERPPAEPSPGGTPPDEEATPGR
jgi:hypothetical protein